MKARITVSIPANENGPPDEVEIRLNPEGLRKLIAELQKLDEKNEHFHMFTEDWGSDELSNRPYAPDTHIAHHLKVMLRLDEWDREHYSHVMADQ